MTLQQAWKATFGVIVFIPSKKSPTQLLHETSFIFLKLLFFKQMDFIYTAFRHWFMNIYSYFSGLSNDKNWFYKDSNDLGFSHCPIRFMICKTMPITGVTMPHQKYTFIKLAIQSIRQTGNFHGDLNSFLSVVTCSVSPLLIL